VSVNDIFFLNAENTYDLFLFYIFFRPIPPSLAAITPKPAAPLKTAPPVERYNRYNQPGYNRYDQERLNKEGSLNFIILYCNK